MNEKKERLVIDGNAFYEIDIECEKKKKRQQQEEKVRKNNQKRQRG
ncbi:MAG: hypothetical protein PUI16_03185 [Clostridia bacterium]|nr:hypothetical protein [Clostridia bacterium]MDY5553958.1 hypothetical protein [Blautia sp.]